jgi:hypothetical protein
MTTTLQIHIAGISSMSSSSVSGYCNPESSKVKGFAQIEKTLFEWYSFFVGDKSPWWEKTKLISGDDRDSENF